ncbi:MAG TPA: hypothetical protein P5277_00745 [Candidatus Paceibacterota bacterium]|nr:hypothetical protein [Candidatus Paceibacterota bacterium]
MTNNPRYSKQVYYGKDFEKEMELFNKSIKKDSRFTDKVKHEDQGRFSLAIRLLIHNYLVKRLERLKQEQEAEANQPEAEQSTNQGQE